MIFGIAIGVLAGTLLLVLATVVHRAGRARPDNQMFAATAVLVGVHVVVATLAHLAEAASAPATIAQVSLLLQAAVAGLVVLFARAFASQRRAPLRLWLVVLVICGAGSWDALSPDALLDVPCASASLIVLPYLLASFDLLRAARKQAGRRRGELVAAAVVLMLRLGAAFFHAGHGLGVDDALHEAQSIVPVHAYLDAGFVVVIGLIVLRRHLLDSRRVLREAALPVVVAAIVPAYASLGAAATPWLCKMLGLQGASLALLLPVGFIAWAAWTWHDMLLRASTAFDPRRRVRRDVLEKVIAVTANVVDAEAVLGMVRAAMIEVFDGEDVQFRRASGVLTLPGISRTIPQGWEPVLGELREPFAAAASVIRSEGDAREAWPGGDACVLIPVRRGRTLFGVFEVPVRGRLLGEDLATTAALADQFAVKLENLQLFTSLSRAGRELAGVQRFLADLIDSLPVGVVGVVGPELRVRLWNPAEAKRTGISKERALGMRYLEDESGAHVAPAIAAAIRKNPRDILSFPNVDAAVEGSRTAVDVTVAPLRARGIGGESGYVIIFVDTSERNALQQEIEEFRRLAALGQMAAAIAHDVRTPLSSMRMSVQILRSKTTLPPEDAEYFDLILESIARLGQQVDELLDFTKPALLRVESVELRELAADARDVLAQKAGSRNVEIVVDVKAGTAAPADESKLRQALVNLMSNAVEASAPGSQVVVTARLERDEAIVLVRDVGAGIAPQDVQRIWEPFFTTRPDGTGLGLAIVRKNVLAHGGTIHVRSESGQGTEFEIRLPIHRETEVVVSIEDCRRAVPGE